jgi:hypothetical protein
MSSGVVSTAFSKMIHSRRALPGIRERQIEVENPV